MKRRIIIKLVILICSLFLCVTASAAWILDLGGGEYKGYALEIDYQNNRNDPEGNSYKLSVINANSIILEIWKQNPENPVEYVKVDNELLDFGIMLPNDNARFRIRLYNTSQERKPIHLYMAGISTMNADGTPLPPDSTIDLADVFYLFINGGEGYRNSQDTTLPLPRPEVFKISDRKFPDNEACADLYTELVVPPTLGGSYVELDCRLWFSSEAESEYSDKKMVISYFAVSD